MIMMMRQTQKEKEEKKHHSLLSLLPFQRNPHLPSATGCLLSSPSAPTNLHSIFKTFTLTQPSMDKTIFATHPRYIVTIEIILNQIQCKVTQIKFVVTQVKQKQNIWLVKEK